MKINCLVKIDKNCVFEDVIKLFVREKDMQQYIAREYPNAVEVDDYKYKLIDESILLIKKVDEE